MNHLVTLSDQELTLLEELLKHETIQFKSEHRRTRNRDFREELERRESLAEFLLEKIEQVRYAPSEQ